MQTGTSMIRRELYHQMCQCRRASSLSKNCPFRILGVSRETEYAQIKKKFLKIALQNHPDVISQQLVGTRLNDAEKEAKRRECTQIFMNARQAFELIVPVDNGGCALRSEVEQETSKSQMSKEEFDAWFLNETGRNNPYQFDLDPATMREVADMTEKLGDFGGGERDGGMWTLARMITSSVNSGKDAASILRLEAGEIQQVENPIDGRIRRRRQSRFE